jgi:hypothetical protein
LKTSLFGLGFIVSAIFAVLKLTGVAALTWFIVLLPVSIAVAFNVLVIAAVFLFLLIAAIIVAVKGKPEPEPRINPFTSRGNR